MTYRAVVAIYGLRAIQTPTYYEGLMVPMMAWFKEHRIIQGWVEGKVMFRKMPR